MIIAAVFWCSALVVVVLCIGRAWSGGAPHHARERTPGRVFAGRSRDQVLRSGVDAVVLLGMVRALFPPPGWASWLWVAAAVGVGVGVAGLISSWRRRPSGRRRWPTVAYVIAGAALVVVLA